MNSSSDLKNIRSETPKRQQLLRRKKVTRFKDSIDYGTADMQTDQTRKIVNSIPANKLI